MSTVAMMVSRIAPCPAAVLPPGFGYAIITASAITTGSNSTDEYVAALAIASAVPAPIIQMVTSSLLPARITHQAARAVRNSDRVTLEAKAPSASVGPRTAKIAVAKKA